MLLTSRTALLLAIVLLCLAGGCSPAERAIPTPAPTIELREGAVSPSPDGPRTAPSPSPTREPVSLDWLTAPVRVPALPASFAQARPEPPLHALLQETLEGLEGRYSVVVRHLSDGRSAAVDPDQVYYAASLFKLAVLLTAYRERDAGRLDFQRTLSVDGWYADQDLGTMEGLGIERGDRVTVDDAIKAMIVVSDTPTALLVQDAAGDQQVEATLRRDGAQDSSVLSPDLPTTAGDIASLMLAIAGGRDVSHSSRQEMIALLLQEHIHDGIIAGVPEGTPVAHKTGNYDEATHDAAVVWAPGGPYLLVVLTDRPWDWEPVVRVSQAVYRYFEGASPSTSGPP